MEDRRDNFPYLRICSTLNSQTEDYLRLNREAIKTDEAYRKAKADHDEIERSVKMRVLGNAKTLNDVMKIELAEIMRTEYADSVRYMNDLYSQKLRLEMERDNAYAQMQSSRTALGYISAEVRRSAAVFLVDAVQQEAVNLDREEANRTVIMSISDTLPSVDDMEEIAQSWRESAGQDANASGVEVPPLVSLDPGFDPDEIDPATIPRALPVDDGDLPF